MALPLSYAPGDEASGARSDAGVTACANVYAVATRRIAIVLLTVGIAVSAPACRFSRGSSDDEAAESSTTVETLATLSEDTSTSVEDTTTIASTASTRRVATTFRSAAVATTRAPAPRSPTPTAGPHCTVSVADTFYGSSWTASITSTFPGSTVTIDIKWPGGSGNYSGYTDGGGSWSKTQRVQPSMRGQRVNVTVAVGTVHCSTSFMVS